MAKYQTTKGEVEIWALVYYFSPTQHKTPMKVFTFMCPTDSSPAIRVQELKRLTKGTPNAIPQWDEMREATGYEVSQYFSSHPWMLKKSGTDTRVGDKGK